MSDTTTPQTTSSHTVLIVEDDVMISDLYRKKLEKQGFKVEVVPDGVEATKILQTLVPDIILLDIMLPRKDGFAVLSDIKQDPRLKNIPVVVATNLGENEDIDRTMAMALGAKDYIVKSDVPADQIVDRIKGILSKS